ncbi:hypothetical protein LIER_39259 [Lithospermum erythrorhizon]|uniref:Pectate lyase N-terminal domain-containing protein n=1 Tax=Lithospermum erythrorhizon TaxID=34254 RepID=A0AAV3QHG2_LITER
MGKSKLFMIILISFGVIIPTLMAHVAEYDEYWRRRAQESLNNTLKAYHPEPENITASMNMAVHEKARGYDVRPQS